MNRAPLKKQAAAVWGRVAALNGWQRGAVALTAATIVYFQLQQLADWDYEGDGWFIGLALAGLLVFIALTGRPPSTGVNVWQRIALGVAAVAITLVQFERFSQSGAGTGLGWVGAFLTAGAFLVAAATAGRRRPTRDGQRTAAGEPVASAGASPVATPPALTKRTFTENDVDQFIAGCHTLARDLAPTLLPRAMPIVPVLAAYVEEVALAYAYGVCAFVACVHNQQWPKSRGSAAVMDRLVTDLTVILTKDDVAAITREKAQAAGKALAAEYLEGAQLAAHGFCELANEESHQLVRALADAAKGGKRPELRMRAPSGPQLLAAWLDAPESSENHLAFIQAILGKAVGAEFHGTDFRVRLEVLYGPLTRKMIEHALVLMSGLPDIPGRANAGSKPLQPETSSPKPEAEHADLDEPSNVGFIAMMDIDNFDALNEKFGRAAGDEVMRAYVQVTASMAQTDTILNEVGLCALLGQAKRRSGDLGYVLCRPYSSGDEFIVFHPTLDAVRSLVERVAQNADGLEVPLHDETGKAVGVLHGIPVSIGCGRSRREAWAGVLAQKKTRVRVGMADRFDVRTAADTPAPPAPEFEEVMRTYLEVLRDEGTSARPADFASSLHYLEPSTEYPPDWPGVPLCGCCAAPFALVAQRDGLWVAKGLRDSRPVPICAVCIMHLNSLSSPSSSQRRLPLSSTYDTVGQQLATKWGTNDVRKLAVMRIMVARSRLKGQV